MKSMPDSSACPYSLPMSDDDDTVEEAITVAKQSCPAFQEAQCPFRSAKTPGDVKEALGKLPKSHLESESFQKAFQHVHRVSQVLVHTTASTNTNAAAAGNGVLLSLTQAMEKFSLGAIVASLASELDLVNLTEQQGAEAVLTSENEENDEGRKEERSEIVDESSGLAQALQTGTAASHEAAENVHFVRNFIRGQIDRNLYGDLVVALFYIYECLEKELNQHGPQNFPSLHFPYELSRTEALEDDVDFWHGDEWRKRQEHQPSPATRDYVQRLQHVAETEPLLLLSHAYTRYLGDLSGGRILARVARKALGVKKDGLRFYEFEHIPNPKKFKDSYRLALNSLGLSQNQVSRLVAEANVAFVLNMRIFEELDVKAGLSTKVRDLDEALSFLHDDATRSKDQEAKCPFMEVGPASMPSTVITAKSGKCPWPFVFFHDPMSGMKDYKTWVVIGLILSWAWSLFKA